MNSCSWSWPGFLRSSESGNFFKHTVGYIFYFFIYFFIYFFYRTVLLNWKVTLFSYLRNNFFSIYLIFSWYRYLQNSKKIIPHYGIGRDPKRKSGYQQNSGSCGSESTTHVKIFSSKPNTHTPPFWKWNFVSHLNMVSYTLFQQVYKYIFLFLRIPGKYKENVLSEASEEVSSNITFQL